VNWSRLGLCVLTPVLLLAGCGQERRAARPLAPVKLTIDGPTDATTVDADSVEVHGQVVPAAARVLIGGDEADVRDGAFSLVVALEAGANVIDIQAGAPRHPAAMTALRIVREVPVEIPTLEGRPPDEAVQALQDLGLRTELADDGGILDALIGGTEGVCGTDPGPGELVKTGTVVLLRTSKAC